MGGATPGRIRVLIVDDHRLFADSLKLLLDRVDTVEVVGIAGDGLEAVDLALLADAEGVLMALVMRRVDGFEATRRLRAIKRAAKVIGMSGRPEAEVRAELDDAGIGPYLEKENIYDGVVAAILRAAGEE